jgi:hypothetical protein
MVIRFLYRTRTPKPLLAAAPRRDEHMRCGGAASDQAALPQAPPAVAWNGLRNPLRRSADIASGCLVGPRKITPSARILRILDEIGIKE